MQIFFPGSTFLDDHSYWGQKSKQKKYLEIGKDSKINEILKCFFFVTK